MELKHLKLIKTITEEGSIANSSERLFLTQSALSHQLRDLEQTLGFKVFLRTRNEWTLTTEGKALYELATKVLDELDEGLNTIQHIRSGSKGKIRISTECYSFYQGLPAFIQKMGVLYPQIEIDLVIEATHHPVAKILSNELDIAIVTTRPPNEALEVIPVFEDEIHALMHQEHPLSEKAYIQPDDLQHVHLLVHSFPLETVAIHELCLKPGNITPAKISAIPLTEVALEMVGANLGVMCVPKWTLRKLTVPKDCIFKRIGKAGLKRKHYLVMRKDDVQKRYFHDFIQNIEEDLLSAKD